MVSGFASRFKIVKKDALQITGFLLAGDAINIPSILTEQPFVHVIANLKTEICWIERDALHFLCSRRPNIAAALWLDTFIDAEVAQEWMANIGRRNARERIVHLFLEMATRQERLGAIRGNTFELPLTQSEISRALGLSLVHTNKSIRWLVSNGMIRREGHFIELVDRQNLEKQVGFDPAYLRLGSGDPDRQL